MKVRRGLMSVAAIMVCYLAALTWIDSSKQVFAELPKLGSAVPVLFALSFLSYILRYLRWHWLLKRAGCRTEVLFGFLAYLSGFAFTATPGKIGELVRIRYLARYGVPPARVLAAFVFERALDLMTVLVLAALVVTDRAVFNSVLGFVALLLGALALFAFNPSWLTRISAYFRFYQLEKFSRIGLLLRDGLAGCRLWLTSLDLVVSAVLGAMAWSLTSFSFVWLVSHLGVTLPLLSALALYPLAMLAGVASLLPGGIGSTELALVVLLSLFDVSLGSATLAAIGIRFASMWFAVICGFLAAGTLEVLLRKAICKSVVRPTS